MTDTSLDTIYREALTATTGEVLVLAAMRADPRLRMIGPVTLFAVGKAAASMARGACAALKVGGGLIIATANPSGVTGGEPPLEFARLGMLAGAHPLPDERSVEAGSALLKRVRAVPDGEPVLFLISGGASSLAVGLAEGISLEDKRTSARILMAAGANIHELNAIRKHLSSIKGGLLGAACAASPRLALVLSDVVDGDLATVGSGPTVPDPSTFEDCLEIINRLRVSLPESVVARLALGAAGRVEETPKSGDARLEVQTVVIGGPETLLTEACAACRRAGLDPVPVPIFSGEIDVISGSLADQAKGLLEGQCLVGVGEVTVASGKARAGQGGRALHLGMRLAQSLSGTNLRWLVAGSDGQDATTPYAGAEADGSSWSRISASEGEARLARFQSASLAEAIGRPIPAFSSGTNLTDLVLIRRSLARRR